MWETLWYAARLRLPRTMPLAEQAGRVTMVVKALGLQKCRDTLIGAQPQKVHLKCEWQACSAVLLVMEAFTVSVHAVATTLGYSFARLNGEHTSSKPMSSLGPSA